MTLPRLTAISERWAHVPPLSVTVAGIASALGLRLESSDGKRKLKDETSFEDFVEQMIGAGMKQEGTPEWLKKST